MGRCPNAALRWHLSYTIEKFIHGKDKWGAQYSQLLILRRYNSIQPWKYTKLLEVFGAHSPRTYRVQTQDELVKLFLDKEFASCPDIQVFPRIQLSLIKLVELIMDELDCPRALKVQASLTAQANAA